MNKYTKEGIQVEVVKEIEGGFLVKEYYHYDYSDYDFDLEEESFPEDTTAISDKLIFYSELFDKPLTAKYADEVIALKNEAQSLENEIHELKIKKSNENSLLKKVSKYPIVQTLVDYFNDDYTHIMFLRFFECRKRESVYMSPYIRMSNTKNEPYALYQLRNDYYSSDSDDKPFLIFKSEEDMQAEAKKRILDKIAQSNYRFNYNKSNNLKQLWSDIHSSCTAKKDEEVINAYNAKLKAFETEERIEKEKALKEEFEALKKKQELLEKSINK